MGLEVELKYRVPPSQLPNIRAALTQRWGEPNTQLLENRYFDDIQHTLAGLKMGLRVRQGPGFAEQTLKTAGATQGARSARPEYNAPCPELWPDLSQVPAAAWPASVDTSVVQKQLQEQFRVTFTRLTWVVAHGQATIEVALDDGVIEGGQHQAVVSELELELMTGSEADMTALGQTLATEFALQPGGASKAQRGYALLAEAG